MGLKPTIAVRASRPTAPARPDADPPPVAHPHPHPHPHPHHLPPVFWPANQNMEVLTIPQLIDFLRSSFDREDFERATRIILSRQQALRGEIKREFVAELTRREVEKIELQARCDGLEREIAEERERYASLVARLVESGRGRAAARGEADKCRRACEVLEAQIGRLKGGFDAACGRARGAQAKIGQLLEILREKKEVEEKMSAEIDWRKRKCEELEARVLEMEKESMRMRGRGKQPCMNGKCEDHGSQSSARPLPKLEVGSRMIEFNDSKDGVIVDADTHMSSEMAQIAEKNAGAVEDGDDRTSKKIILPTSTPKRKCLSRIIACNSGDTEETERIPLCKVRKLKKNTSNCSFSGNGIQGALTPSLKCLFPLQEVDEAKGMARGNSTRCSTRQNQPPTGSKAKFSSNRIKMCPRLDFSGFKYVEEDDDVGSESEGERLGGFVIDDSDGSGSKSNSNSASEEEEQTDIDVKLDEVLAKIHREKCAEKWKYEIDMLCAFAENTKLCMRAVCTLWRLQMQEEQSTKQTIANNYQKSDKFDTERVSTMVEFLTDGDPCGPLKKTVKELQEFDPKGSEYCRQIARHYSSQLFRIYRNNGDSFFHPN